MGHNQNDRADIGQEGDPRADTLAVNAGSVHREIQYLCEPRTVRSISAVKLAFLLPRNRGFFVSLVRHIAISYQTWTWRDYDARR